MSAFTCKQINTTPKSTVAASINPRVCRLSSSRQGGGWYRELRSGVGEVWELHYLSVSLEDTQGGF